MIGYGRYVRGELTGAVTSTDWSKVKRAAPVFTPSRGRRVAMMRA